MLCFFQSKRREKNANLVTKWATRLPNGSKKRPNQAKWAAEKANNNTSNKCKQSANWAPVGSKIKPHDSKTGPIWGPYVAKESFWGMHLGLLFVLFSGDPSVS